MKDKIYGIIGGGQLGAMLIDYGINKLDPTARVKVLTTSRECSCAYVKHARVDLVLCDSLDNGEAIKSFVLQCTDVTWETEHFNLSKITSVESSKITSSLEFLRIIQNKRLQKEFYTDHSINTVPYVTGKLNIDYSVEIIENSINDSNDDLDNGKIIVKKLNQENPDGFKCYNIVVKSELGGYDGKGVMVLNARNIAEKWEMLKATDNIIEEYINHKLEISVIWAKNACHMVRFEPCAMEFNQANMLQYCYPLNHVSVFNYMAIDSSIINQQAIVFSYYVMKKLEKYLKNDMVAIEMFYYDNNFYVNEIAPRVHNSGHFTIHACSVSQFELAARLLMNYPIVRPDLLYDYMMYNVIGPKDIYGPYSYYDNLPERNNYGTIKGSYFVDYHKKETRPFRKMGHMTFLFETLYENENESIEMIKAKCREQSVKIVNPREKPKIGVIMGSKSDVKVMENVRDIFEQFEQPYEFLVVSAHRTPQRLYEYAEKARQRGLKVIVAGAGGAAHLPGMVASLTNVPVIGVPIRTESLNGLDSLYSIVQMPPNVPVACMAINGSQNAALYALQILAIENEELYERLKEYKMKIANQALSK